MCVATSRELGGAANRLPCCMRASPTTPASYCRAPLQLAIFGCRSAFGGTPPPQLQLEIPT